MSTLKSKIDNEVLIVYFTDIKIIDEPRIREIGGDLEAIIEKAPSGYMLVSFRGVQFMGSAMIGKLISFHKKCQSKNVDLRFCDISPNILEAIKMLKLHKMWKLYKDEAKGIESFHKKGLFG